MSGFHGNSRPGGGQPPRGGGYGGGGPRAPGPGNARTAPGGRAEGGNGGNEERGCIGNLLRPPAQPVRYFSPNDPKAVEPRLLGEEAEQVARKLRTVPASQLRRFYAEVTALKRRAELADASDEEIRSALMLLRAKAAYTWQRQSRYPGELVAFFTRHAASVKTRHDFLRGFQPHFEAVMAFHKVFEEKRGAEG
ncbi:type III-A CRISPR-associated protein Csm2 [Caldovatus aquaticus]|uniref:CRISPR system Cms protein Csm2 n=1 Tax=Caldovatus aquaticus TaxID=2865671 RepID=A0ABS7F098_9PROT|nr:type III-A CRISPR-associated protein Csm2 [Caldovatus aquaticus]MBW8269019.1 type III-A CRISPR-associated protein Csm2 [Caldovatus aquaticus]